MSNISPAKHHTTVNSQQSTYTANRGTPCNQKGFIQERKWLYTSGSCSPILQRALPVSHCNTIVKWRCLDTGLLPLLYTPFWHVLCIPQYKSHICVLDMQITQSAQSVQITEYTCQRPHVGVFVQLLPRPAWYSDYSYKYHLTTNTVGTTAGTTGTCGDGEMERWRALAGRNSVLQPPSPAQVEQGDKEPVFTNTHQLQLQAVAPGVFSCWGVFSTSPVCASLCTWQGEKFYVVSSSTCIHTHTFFWRIPQIFMNIVSCGLSAAGGVIFPYFPHLWIFLSERAAGSSLASPTSNVNILCM